MKNGIFLSGLIFCLAFCCVVQAQPSDITYQGRLDSGGQPANANYDFEFRLYDALDSGNLLETQTRFNVTVAGGVFTVQLSFAPALFDGTNRFLEIAVKTAGSPGGYQQLLPRQPLTSAPYSIRSLTAMNALQLGGILANQFVLTGDTRLSDARNPLANSPNYIQNSAAQQTASNFNISGNGTVGGTLSGNIISAGTQFNFGANRVLRSSGNSLALGVNVGRSNGFLGTNNTFVGYGIASQIQLSSQNAVFGTEAGTAIDYATGNSYFGYRAGFINSGGGNAFFGSSAGDHTTNGFGNTFIGVSSGEGNTTGNGNTFLGRVAGLTNTTGGNNTIIGDFADVASGDLEYATAIGSGAIVGLSNTILLGRIGGSDRVQIPGQLQLVSLATGGSTNLCRTATTLIATCSSSLRYKTNVQKFTGGLEIIRRLRPITFNWRMGGMFDVGFAAEEVNEIEPLLVMRNSAGEIEGVKYAQITTVLVNAINEQQKQIDEQRERLQKQQSEINEMKEFICLQNPAAAFCQEKKP